MASRRKMSRRPRKRAQTRRKRRIIRKRRLRSVRRYRRQKRSARTRSRLPKRLSKRLPKRLSAKKVRMTRDAWGMLHSYVDGIYRKVSGEAERLRKKERRPSVISSDVQTALRQIMPKKESRRGTRIR